MPDATVQLVFYLLGIGLGIAGIAIFLLARSTAKAIHHLQILSFQMTNRMDDIEADYLDFLRWKEKNDGKKG